MRYALAIFGPRGMVPALYCQECAEAIGPDADPAYHWETVLLSEDEDFSCDQCFTTEADSTPIMGSAWLQGELEPRLNTR